MAKDDFFLSFGTDADVFAAKIEAESERATDSIYNLAQALKDYDTALENTKRGGPLSTLFGALDDAAQKFGSLTTQLVTGMDSALRGVGELTNELAGLVDAVNKINSLKPTAKKKTSAAVAEITDDEILATDSARRTSKAVGEVIELNATQARNALKRVADINATVGRNSNSAADGLKELARQIRELNGAAKEAKGRGTFAPGTPGGFAGGPQVIVVQNGTVQAGAGVNVQTIVDEALKVADATQSHTAEPQPQELTDAAVDAAINQGVRGRKQPLTRLSQEEFQGPATSGRYILPSGEERGFGFDVRPDETYEQYVARNNKVRETISLARSNLPRPDQSDLADFRRFRQTGGSEANETFQRLLEKTPGAISTEQIKASFERVKIGGLTRPQIDRLPEVLARISKVRAEQAALASEALQHIIDEDPFATFQGGALGVTNSDVEIESTFARQLNEIDERLAVEGTQAQQKGVERRRDARDAGRALRFQRDPSSTTREGRLSPTIVGTRDDIKEGLTQSQIEKKERQRRAEGKKQNEASVREYERLAAERDAEVEAAFRRRQGEYHDPEGQRAQSYRALEGEKVGGDVQALTEALTAAPTTKKQLFRGVGDFGGDLQAGQHVTLPLSSFSGDRERAEEFSRHGEKNVLFQLEPGARALGAPQGPDENGLTFDHEKEALTAGHFEVLRAEWDEEEELYRVHIRALKDQLPNVTRTPINIKGDSGTEEAEQNYRTVYRGSEEPLDLSRIGEEGLRVTQQRDYAEEYGGKTNLYRARVPASKFRISEFTGEEELHTRLTAEEIEQYGGFEQIVGADAAVNSAQADRKPAGKAKKGTGKKGALKEARERLAGLKETVISTDREYFDVQEQIAEVTALIEELSASSGGGAAASEPVTPNETSAKKGGRKNRGALKDAREKLAALHEEVNASEGDVSDLEQQIADLEARIAELSAARGGGGSKGGGGGGRKPPRNAAAAGEPEPDDQAGRPRGGVFDQDTSKAKNRSTSQQFQTDYSQQLELLKPTTRAILEDAKARLIDTQAIQDQTERIRQQDAILIRAGAAFKNDPHFKNFPNLTTARGTFAQGVGLPPSKDNYNTLQQLFTRGGSIDASGLVNSVRKVTEAAGGSGGAGGGGNNGGLLGQKLFGNKGFLDAQLRHIGLAIENFAGFQLVFTGFEKLKELVETGIQADAAFVRLQASITAAGRSVGNLRQQLQNVSSRTATGLHDTIEAASELTGVFKNNQDLTAGTQVAAELANISQGALTAKESAIGLRDVIDAYGLTGQKSVRQVGDEIARLSQTTGVSVKDILEGTTQLAQEAKLFGLKQRQASVLSAYVTRATGETGEAAAEQVSRILSTLDNGKVQTTLERIVNPKTGKPLATPQQFSEGKIGDVLGNVLQNYDDLAPGQQSELRALLGTGRQFRALAGLLRDAKAASDEFNNSSKDQGSLAAQNERFLNTLAGTLKTLGTDFKNLGATLMQSGFFNIIGLFAKGMDDVLKVVTKILNVFNQIADSNPFTKAIKDVGVLVAEVALLFRIASGSLGNIAGFINPSRRMVPQYARNGSAILDAEGRAAMGFAPLTAREVVRAPLTGFNAARQGLRTRRGIALDEFGYPAAFGYGQGGPGSYERVGRSFSRTRVGNFLFPSAASLNGGVATEEQAAASAASRFRQGIQLRGSALLAGVTAGRFGTPAQGPPGAPATGTTAALNRFSGGLVASTAALIAFTFIIDKLSAAEKNRKEISSQNKDTTRNLTGETAAEDKAKNEGKTTERTDAQKNADKANNPGIFDVIDDRFHGDTEYDPNTIGGVDIGFDRETFSFDKLLNKRLRSSKDKITAAGNDPTARKAAQKNLEDQYIKGEKDIEEQAKFIKGLGLNPKQEANALAQLELSKKLFEESYDKLHALADGINDIDRLNIQQVENLNAALTESANLTPETLTGELGERIKQSILSNSGLPTESQAYKDLEKSLAGGEGGKTTTSDRLKAQVAADEEGLKSAQEAVDTAPVGGDEAKRAITARDAATAKLQNDRKALRDLTANNAQSLATQAISTGDTKGALTQTTSAINALEEANKHLSKDDPEYISNLQKINDLKKQFADQTYETAILADDLAAASTNDPLVRARAEYNKAIQQQKSVDSRPHSAAEKEQADAAVASSNIAKAQAAEDLRVAQYQQNIAGRVDNQSLIQDQINEILKEEQKYASGTLASQVKLAQLKAQEIELREKLAQTAGEEADAALETQIAELQARGQAGDLEKAAQLQVSEIQNKMARYLKRPGAKKTDAAYQQLAAQLATARRNSFDVALQAQLDTLDFQRETYKITSSQEVQALQEILKNKQLTLKEQRDITLKIKNLQESIRQQLTGGGFNIPSDIKLPTAYQVRRSLGGGFGNGQTTVNNVSNATNQVTVNNNVPTAAVAQQIANQVISLINSQTGQSARANTSTPRLVGT